MDSLKPKNQSLSSLQNHDSGYYAFEKRKAKVDRYLEELKGITQELQDWSQGISWIPFVVILYVFASSLPPLAFLSTIWWVKLVFILLSSFAILLTGLHERAQKKGDDLFEEISNELQSIKMSDYTNETEKESSNQLKEISSESRIVLRSFAKATNLPLIPGKFGETFYLVLNIILICVIIFVL